MAVLTSFITDFEAYLALWILKTNTNQRQAEEREETLRKLHSYHDVFMLNGRDGNYTAALAHYQTMLGLLNILPTQPEWLVDITDLQTFFGTVQLANNQVFQTATFANPLILDVSLYKNWKCVITDDTEVQLSGNVNGDCGQIVLKIDGVGGQAITFNSGNFTLLYGEGTVSSTAGDSNIISWITDDADTHYIINSTSPLS